MHLAARRPQNKVAHALSNGFGLIMVRVCIILLTALVTVMTFTGRNIMERIDSRLDKIDGSLEHIQSDVTVLKIDDAVTKQRIRDMTAGR